MPAVYNRCGHNTHPWPYVSVDGHYWPCCWVPNHPHITTIRNFLGDKYQQLDTNYHTLDEIQHSAALRMLRDSWEDGSFKPCLIFCSKPVDVVHDSLAQDDMLTIDLKTGCIN